MTRPRSEIWSGAGGARAALGATFDLAATVGKTSLIGGAVLGLKRPRNQREFDPRSVADFAADWCFMDQPTSATLPAGVPLAFEFAPI